MRVGRGENWQFARWSVFACRTALVNGISRHKRRTLANHEEWATKQALSEAQPVDSTMRHMQFNGGVHLRGDMLQTWLQSLNVEEQSCFREPNTCKLESPRSPEPSAGQSPQSSAEPLRVGGSDSHGPTPMLRPMLIHRSMKPPFSRTGFVCKSACMEQCGIPRRARGTETGSKGAKSALTVQQQLSSSQVPSRA